MKRSNEELRNFKSLIGRFHDEMKSNSITDLVIWLDCKLKYHDSQKDELEKIRQKI